MLLIFETVVIPKEYSSTFHILWK